MTARRNGRAAAARHRARSRREPRALTIAGSDTGGGAGIQADLRTFAARGVHGMSVLAALTAQSTRGVRAVLAVPPAFVRAQIDAVLDDLGADAVKTGMLLDARTVAAVADALIAHGRPPLVVDPVITAKDGTPLLARAAVGTLRARLLPLATVVTPNRAEAAVLTGLPVRDRGEMEAAARALRRLGARAVVVTGGDVAGDPCDLLLTAEGAVWLRARRVPGAAAHGTGCAFSAAIAAELAKGATTAEAVVRAKRYVTGCIRRARQLGGGHPTLDPGPAHRPVRA